jgi:hypothetical protein
MMDGWLDAVVAAFLANDYKNKKGDDKMGTTEKKAIDWKEVVDKAWGKVKSCYGYAKDFTVKAYVKAKDFFTTTAGVRVAKAGLAVGAAIVGGTVTSGAWAAFGVATGVVAAVTVGYKAWAYNKDRAEVAGDTAFGWKRFASETAVDVVKSAVYAGVATVGVVWGGYYALVGAAKAFDLAVLGWAYSAYFIVG